MRQLAAFHWTCAQCLVSLVRLRFFFGSHRHLAGNRLEDESLNFYHQNKNGFLNICSIWFVLIRNCFVWRIIHGNFFNTFFITYSSSKYFIHFFKSLIRFESIKSFITNLFSEFDNNNKMMIGKPSALNHHKTCSCRIWKFKSIFYKAPQFINRAKNC